jgi:hypothetical protein
MNEDYLWNKTGEPEAEIKELEEVLGVLRYQPRQLELPGEIVLSRKRNFMPLLAIAATAAGMWFILHSRNSAPTHQAVNPSPERRDAPSPVATPGEQQAANKDSQPGRTAKSSPRIGVVTYSVARLDLGWHCSDLL